MTEQDKSERHASPRSACGFSSQVRRLATGGRDEAGIYRAGYLQKRSIFYRCGCTFTSCRRTWWGRSRYIRLDNS